MLTRTDNIGDLILTLPAVASLKRRYPDIFIGFLCSSYAAPVLLQNPAINKIIPVDDGFPFTTLKVIREGNYHASLHFFIEPKGTILARMANIPRRIGPASKIWSVLLTDKVSQNRSKVERHEAEYNLELARECGADGLSFPPAIFLSALEKREGQQILSMACKVPEPSPVVIHPGSHQHVETWPIDHFMELAKKIGDRGDKVVFTAGPGEEKFIEAAQQLRHKNVHTLTAGSLALRQLAAVISNARIFIGNSSGPLHIATALNIPTISFYPQVPLVTSAKRWGPFGNSKLHRVLTPTPADRPLKNISSDMALEWVINVLQSKAHPDSSGEQFIG